MTDITDGWIRNQIAVLRSKLLRIALLDDDQLVRCYICNGKAPDAERCGCNGTQTAVQARAYLESEIEILCDG